MFYTLLVTCCMLSFEPGCRASDLPAWASAALSLLRPEGEVNLYLAPADPRGTLPVVFPDGWTVRTPGHVLLLDPSPGVPFGHPVFLFFGLSSSDADFCRRGAGRYLGDGRCLIPVCRNGTPEDFPRPPCHFDFLPLVTAGPDSPRQDRQRLVCQDDLPGFSPCPRLRPLERRRSLFCDHLRSNRRRCPPPASWRSGCGPSEGRGRALLLSGGWNGQTTDADHPDRLRNFYRKLREDGYRPDDVRVFFANGANDASGEMAPVYPSSLKSDFRFLLKRTCKSVCLDTLLIYLNSPATRNGSSLLWDADGDGKVDPDEEYSAAELSSDLDNCRAGRVLLLLDQSFSDRLVDAISPLSRYRNVFVLSGEKVHTFRQRNQLDAVSTSSLPPLSVHSPAHEMPTLPTSLRRISAAVAGSRVRRSLSSEGTERKLSS
ncbi:uncharacterized protein [Centruroides vittatus]|uniref:uncharacterized protein n=1 Tax=Centruroides vittatus TaxID=120091 RepID=UPI00350EB8C5